MPDERTRIHQGSPLPVERVRQIGRQTDRCRKLTAYRPPSYRRRGKLPAGRNAEFNGRPSFGDAVFTPKRTAAGPDLNNGSVSDTDVLPAIVRNPRGGELTDPQKQALIDRILRDPQQEIDELIIRVRRQNSLTVPGSSWDERQTVRTVKEDAKHIDFYCSDMSGSTHKPEQDLDQRVSLAIRQVIDRYGRVLLSSRGQSMFPYIREGDNCTFLARDAGFLKRGDIVLYQAPSGVLIAHRFLGTQRDAFGLIVYIVKGDSNLKPDPPVYPGQIIGIMTKIEPASHKFRLSHIFHRTWCRLVLDFPLTSKCVNKYLVLRNRLAMTLKKR